MIVVVIVVMLLIKANTIKLINSDKEPDEAARMIKETFHL